MAEKLKDSEDLKLEALFRSEPVPDGGFSGQIVARVRRRMWVQRLTLPAAIGAGTIIALKPVAQLVSLVPKVVAVVPQNLMGVIDLPAEGLVQGPTIILGGILLAVMLMVGRMLEE
jgi:hypothetical protein